jgi:hypothetical protein
LACETVKLCLRKILRCAVNGGNQIHGLLPNN